MSDTVAREEFVVGSSPHVSKISQFETFVTENRITNKSEVYVLHKESFTSKLSIVVYK